MGETRDLNDDAEITLGTGKLLGIFFGLAALCAVFFTMGYMLGRSSAAGAKTDVIGSAPSGNTANKPSAANNKGPDASAQNCVPGSANCPATASTAPDATNGQPSTTNTQPQAPTSTDSVPTATTANTSTAPANPEVKNVSSGSFIVQVAAVSKQEDAELLVAALRKKQYPVFLSAGGGDAYFRVQVGPFTDMKEAEATRARLANEGYNPIIKK